MSVSAIQAPERSIAKGFRNVPIKVIYLTARDGSMPIKVIYQTVRNSAVL